MKLCADIDVCVCVCQNHNAYLRSFNGEGGDTGQGGGVINAANQSVYDGMATIVEEMADVFKSSPYIHVGCDETSTPPSLPGYKPFAKVR